MVARSHAEEVERHGHRLSDSGFTFRCRRQAGQGRRGTDSRFLPPVCCARGIRTQYAELRDLREQSTRLEKEILTTMVMSELEKPRDTFILARGDYRNKTDKVEPGTPAVLPPLPKTEGRPNRLTLASWLVDPSHPLTARVAVNRYWQMYFGTGLVKTAENFGSQGEPPRIPNCSTGSRPSSFAPGGT